MRLSVLHLGVFAAVLLASGMAFAVPAAVPLPRNHAAPAPLLAAGIPAFLALGGGAAVTKFSRRFRGSK